jgi:hypothetical protein
LWESNEIHKDNLRQNAEFRKVGRMLRLSLGHKILNTSSSIRTLNVNKLLIARHLTENTFYQLMLYFAKVAGTKTILISVVNEDTSLKRKIRLTQT